MLNRARLPALVLAVGLLSGGLAVLECLPAGASVNSVEGAPTKGLLTAGEAGRLGFTKSVGKPLTSKKTGVVGCAIGAQAEFEDAKRATGVLSEVLVCKSANVPAGLMVKAKKAATTPLSQKPPKSLGVTAFERAAGSSTYAIYWQRGKLLELVAIDVNIPASSSSTTTPVSVAPLTAKQQQTLIKAALEQDTTAH